MANPDHLDLLRQGVKQWNEWRAGNPEIKADLRGADLNRAHFHAADLSGADLRGADLHATDLSEADLSSANLGGAYLRGVNLNKAKLNKADLSGADLTDSTNLTRNQLAAAESFDGARLPPDLESHQATKRKGE